MFFILNYPNISGSQKTGEENVSSVFCQKATQHPRFSPRILRQGKVRAPE
jgi:hypothetical protein